MKSTIGVGRKRVAGRMSIGAILLAAVLAVPGALANDAEDILKAMSDYISSQKNIEFTFDSAIEIITPQLEKIQFTNSNSALISRPDKLRVHRLGGYTDVTIYFDGKQLSIDGKSVNGYAQLAVPGNVDQLIHFMRDSPGLVFAGADLLLSNASEVLLADVMEARYIGRGVINGRECEHLAFRNFDTDWQLWVQVGDLPIPCKLVITSKTVNSAPQYSLYVTSWSTDIQPEKDAFEFTPPATAQQLDPNELDVLDEVPRSAPAGEGP